MRGGRCWNFGIGLKVMRAKHDDTLPRHRDALSAESSSIPGIRRCRTAFRRGSSFTLMPNGGLSHKRSPCHRRLKSLLDKDLKLKRRKHRVFARDQRGSVPYSPVTTVTDKLRRPFRLSDRTARCSEQVSRKLPQRFHGIQPAAVETAYQSRIA